MKRTSISNLLIAVGALFLFAVLVVAFSIPKAVLIDRELSKVGVNLIARSVKESLLGVSFEGVSLFYGNAEVAYLDKVEADIGLLGVDIRLVCGEEFAVVSVAPNRIRAKTEFLSCFRSVEGVRADLELTQNGVFGRVLLRSVSLGKFELDRVELLFRGNSFEGMIEYAGMEFRGGGEFDLNRENLGDSTVNALFKGEIGRLLLRGKLKNLSVRLE